MAIELGSVVLDQITRVDVRERQRLVRHTVPGMSGNLVQMLGRPSVELVFTGAFLGPSAGDRLETLRDLYLQAAPVDFFSEAVGEGYFAQVVVTGLDVQQRAGHPDEFDFRCAVLEYVEPPEPISTGVLDALDAEILGEALDFVDDIQNTLEELSGLVDLLANAPNFADPTTRVAQMAGPFLEASSGAATVIESLRDLL